MKITTEICTQNVTKKWQKPKTLKTITGHTI